MVIKDPTINIKEHKTAYLYFRAYYKVLWAHIPESVYYGTYNKVGVRKYKDRIYGSQFYLRAATHDPNSPAKEGYSYENFNVRVETRTRNEGDALIIEERKITKGLTMHGVESNSFMILGNNGYYSVTDHSWICDSHFYKIDKDTIPAKDIVDKHGVHKHYKERTRVNRVYDLEALRKAGKIWQYVPSEQVSITGDLNKGTLVRVEQENSNLFGLIPAMRDMEQMAHSEMGLIVKYDPTPATNVFYGKLGEAKTKHITTVREFAASFYNKSSNEFKALVSKIYRYIGIYQKNNILKPIELRGETYYFSNEYADIEQKREDREAKRLVAYDDKKARDKIRNWLKRNNWTGCNKKWSEAELKLAFMLVNEHNVKGE